MRNHSGRLVSPFFARVWLGWKVIYATVGWMGEGNTKLKFLLRLYTQQLDGKIRLNVRFLINRIRKL